MQELQLKSTVYLTGKEYDVAHAQNVINTYSVMLYPDNERFRKIYCSGIFARLAENIEQPTTEISMPISDLIALTQWQDLPPVEQRRLSGRRAGYIFQMIMRCKENHPGWASLATAYSLLSAEHKRENIQHQTKLALRADSLETDWKLMSPVAHLWCSQMNVDSEWMEPGYFYTVLAWAEALRMQGERHYPPQGRLKANSPIKKRSFKPLLNPATTWKVPGTIFSTLPAIIVPPIWEPLPQEALGLLTQKKKF